jgi:serine O-acetyltransferase
MFEYIKADIQALTHQKSGLIPRLAMVFFNLGFHAVFLYRLSRWLHLHHLGPLSVAVAYLNAVFTGAQISRGAAIGKGFIIWHPQGIVVGPTVIGNDCTLMQSNVIGQLRGGGDRPIIGDHFYADGGAKILGKIEIGNDVHVGANSVVIHSLPDGVTAMGVPAIVISCPRK